jgi:hypothetical protein
MDLHREQRNIEKNKKYGQDFAKNYIFFSSKFAQSMLEPTNQWYHYSPLYLRLPTIKVNM